MIRGPAWLFVGGLLVFALLGLLAGSPPKAPPSEVPEPELQTPVALARTWGRLSANWKSRTLRMRLRTLTRSATARLARRLERSLLEPPPKGTRSRGSVRFVDVSGTGPRRHVLVLTREQGTGEPTARFHVYEGVVVREAGAWRMAEWTRQP